MSIKQAIEALEVAQDALDISQSLQESAKSNHHPKTLAAYERVSAALAALRSMPAEPYAYAVYFPDQPTEELVHDLDELLDDMTNREHTITELFSTQPPAEAVRMSEAWQPIETAPRDGSVFVAARFVEGEQPDPDFDYELGHYKPLVFDRYEEAGDNLFRKVPEQVYDWHGFNNFGRMTHWMPLPPVEQATAARLGVKMGDV